MLSSQVLHLRRELMDARAEAEHQLAVLKQQMGRMSNSISRISSLRHATVRRGAAPTTRGTSVAAPTADTNLVVGLVGGANGMVDCAMDVPDVVPVVLEACLTKCPKTLHDLWKSMSLGFVALSQQRTGLLLNEEGTSSSNTGEMWFGRRSVS